MAARALCIGINDYPGTDSDLAGCVNDARDWARALRARGFTTTTLLDRKATGRGMREGIRATLERARRGDVVVIQYSGHGSYVPDVDGDEPDGRDECLCPHDVRARGPITDDELFQLYGEREAGVRLVILSDSCHSGTVARFAPARRLPATSRRTRARRRVRFLPPSTFLSPRAAGRLGASRALRRSDPPGRHAGLLMAGCQDAEYSYDAAFDDRPNGAFTYVALRTLATLGRNATYRQWFQAIRRMLPTEQYPQTPNLFGTAAMKGWKVFA